jgi:hypothetical protein
MLAVFPFWVVPLIKAVSKRTGVALILAGTDLTVSRTSVEIFRGFFGVKGFLQAKKIDAIKM